MSQTVGLKQVRVSGGSLDAVPSLRDYTRPRDASDNTRFSDKRNVLLLFGSFPAL